MDVREKLVELLYDAMFLDGYGRELCEQQADHLIAHGVTVQEWIPASEPPKDHKEYIVMIKDAKCSTTLWYRPKQKTWNEACGDKNYDVTHWQYLPQPPKGE